MPRLRQKLEARPVKARQDSQKAVKCFEPWVLEHSWVIESWGLVIPHKPEKFPLFPKA